MKNYSHRRKLNRLRKELENNYEKVNKNINTNNQNSK